MARRSYGAGSLFVRRDSRGRETWYGKWYSGTRRVKRKIGPKRQPGSRDGLTRPQAERELHRRMESERPVVRSRLTIQSAGLRYLDHLEHVLERKPTTVSDYGYMLRRHFEPFFGSRPLAGIDADEVGRYVVAKKREGLATKTITNHLVFLHGLFAFAVRRRWAPANPVASVDRPRAPAADPDIRYLDLGELDALLRAVPDHRFGPTDHALYVTAAMAGLRQGELLALRWIDVDWQAGRLRVRRSYTRQRFGTPKSRRSSRSVPLSDRVAGELERHFQRTKFSGDEDLVFCHHDTGGPLDPSNLRKRFAVALQRAGLRQIRFHDLRHTFGTHCAASGVPLRTLQEWMGHEDTKTTAVYADYAPSPHERELIEQAFRGPIRGPILSKTEGTPDDPKPHEKAESDLG
jgi:integrase